MEIVVLGSGTSHGVPMIGCDCAVCRSSDPHNRRTRPSIVVHGTGGTILVDTTPELRLQSLANDLKRVDAVLITHTHADHIMGLDDLRRFSDLADAELPVYADAQSQEDIRRVFRYVFVETQMGGGKPRVALKSLQSRFSLCGLEIETFIVMHGRLPVQSYRFTDLATHRSAAYVTDVSAIPPESLAKIYDLDLLILDAVRYDPHPTHFGLYQALDVIAAVQPKQALLTHLSHRFDHETLCSETPAHVAPAYDGQRIILS